MSRVSSQVPLHSQLTRMPRLSCSCCSASLLKARCTCAVCPISDSPQSISTSFVTLNERQVHFASSFIRPPQLMSSSVSQSPPIRTGRSVTGRTQDFQIRECRRSPLSFVVSVPSGTVGKLNGAASIGAAVWNIVVSSVEPSALASIVGAFKPGLSHVIWKVGVGSYMAAHFGVTLP